MAFIHLIEGPVGAGKSTFASALALRNGGVHIALDEWFVTLFSDDRPSTGFVPWYIERKNRCIELIWKQTCGLIASNTDAVLELGLIQRHDRIAFYERVLSEGFDLLVYIVDAPLDVRWERVQSRNLERGRTLSMVVPEHIFVMASNMWEPPDNTEKNERGIIFVADDWSATDIG